MEERWSESTPAVTREHSEDPIANYGYGPVFLRVEKKSCHPYGLS